MEKSRVVLDNVLEDVKKKMLNELTITSPVILNDGRIIMPINKVNAAFVNSDGNVEMKEKTPEFSLGVGGVSVTPLGFIILDTNNDIQLKVIENNSDNNKWIDFIMSAINLTKKK